MSADLNRLTAARAGTTLGRYRLMDRLGAGGMGEVWRAHDANLDREVAIKLLAPGTIGDADTQARFRREALALSRLSHPGIATIFDFDAHEGTSFLVMELVDPDLADAWCSLGFIASNSGDVAGGLRLLRKSVELNPGAAFAHEMLSRGLCAFGRIAEAVAAAERSIELDPLSSIIRTGLGDALYYAREYQKSVFHYHMAIELDPRFDGAHTDLARALEALGRFDEARAAYEEGRRLGGGFAGPSFGLAHLEAAAGNEAEARKILAELTAARGSRVVSVWGIAAVHAALGDVDEAFTWLEAAIGERASGLMWLRVHPRLDPIRQDPRYWPMVERVGLADSPGDA